MAMFGTLGKQTTPVAAFANDPMQAAIKSPVAPAPIAPMPAIQQPKQGFYGDMPMWKVLLGTALDNIAQQTGGQGVFTQGVQMQNMQRQRAASEKARRDAEMQDWLTKQQWERDNPAPRAPHYWEMNDGSLGMVGPDGKPQVLFKDPTPKLQWIQADNGDGTKTLIPVGPNGPLGMKGGDPSISPSPGAASPLPAIGSIVSDPRKAGAGSGQRGFRP